MGIGKRRQDYLPRPATWVDGPGGIQPDSRPWDQVKTEYAFVDELAGLRSKVRGPGNLERFDYWLNTMRYLRAVGRINCTWGRFNAAMGKVKKEQDKDRQKQLARETLLPIRRELVRQVAEAHELLLASITTTGGMGTVANWQQHLLPSLLTQPGKELADILGEPLPADADAVGFLRWAAPADRADRTGEPDGRGGPAAEGYHRGRREDAAASGDAVLGGRWARARSRDCLWSMSPEVSTRPGSPPPKSAIATSSTTCRPRSAPARSGSPRRPPP